MKSHVSALLLAIGILLFILGFYLGFKVEGVLKYIAIGTGIAIGAFFLGLGKIIDLLKEIADKK
ncbi:hypothetical protein [Marinicrinis sediminis]|uniref:Uncharacterized protein n=1 Tax=Marinicrinis sediminis TaxID=1652465 RepID=A0ABW5RDI0_9BACL